MLLKRVIDFQMFTILLWNERTEQFEHRFSSRYGERVTRERTVSLGAGLIGTAAQLREPVLAPDVRKDPRYVSENPETRSELSVPLIYKGQVIGVIDLEHTRVNYYNEDHQRTLSTLAAQVAISIANARLYQRIHEEEQRMERDLEMARKVQLRLMPPQPPKLERAEIAAALSAGPLYRGRCLRLPRLRPGTHRSRCRRRQRKGRSGCTLCRAGERDSALACSAASARLRRCLLR